MLRFKQINYWEVLIMKKIAIIVSVIAAVAAIAGFAFYFFKVNPQYLPTCCRKNTVEE